jgi:hypothetical protein
LSLVWSEASDLGEDEVRPFKLQYKGPLHSDQAKHTDKKKERHDMRRAFHLQLIRAWQLTPALRRVSSKFTDLPYRGQTSEFRFIERDGTVSDGRMDREWAKIKRRNIDFVPLVIRAKDVSLVCELDIKIFWRATRQGGILLQGNEGFDLDNRLKGLLDALAVPQDNQLPDETRHDPNPFLCLLENDNLVTRINIEAAPLGLPREENEEDGYVEILVDVQVHGDELGEDI